MVVGEGRSHRRRERNDMIWVYETRLRGRQVIVRHGDCCVLRSGKQSRDRCRREGDEVSISLFADCRMRLSKKCELNEWTDHDHTPVCTAQSPFPRTPSGSAAWYCRLKCLLCQS
jgi:hypothetical protein